MQSTVLKKLHVAMFAGVSALVMAAPAQAVVVIKNLSATPLSITNTIDGIYLNVVTGVSGATGAAVTGWDINPYNNGAGLTFYGAASPSGILATGTPGTGAIATPLTIGSVVSSAGQFNQFQTTAPGFQVTGTEYVGFRFLNEATAATNYGWMLVSTNATTGFPASVLAYAYENNGGSITVTAVPEPSTFAMFGVAIAGAAGLSAWRRRRSA